MYTKFLKWISSNKTEIPNTIKSVNEFANLVCALMIEVARTDGIIDDQELKKISEILSSQFELSDDEVKAIIKSEIKNSESRIELHSIIKKLREKCSYEERLIVLEFVWLIVLADKKLDHLESSIVRKLCGLLFISDKDAGIISKKVKESINKF